MRIQKWLAHRGHFSRRGADQAIRDGRVLINQILAKPGQMVHEDDRVSLDGQVLAKQTVERQALLYHKPVGVICAKQVQNELPTAWQQLPPLVQGQWVLAGRLDLNTSGLMLATTDGEWVHRLIHPRFAVPRTYRARVFGSIDDDKIKRLLAGVHLEDGEARFDRIDRMHKKTAKEALNQWLEITVHSGRYRMVRRALSAVGLEVNRLIRIRLGPFALPEDLPPGRHLSLTAGDMRYLDQYLSRR